MFIFKKKITEYIKCLSKRMIIVIILTLLVGAGFWSYAAFTEPAVAPADSDQDFTQKILGNNDANNDFSSSSVASNVDGSIVERSEHLIEYLVNSGPTCGNGDKEFGEGCDDGGTSWTAGACAGDCSRRNYWSEPLYNSYYIGAGTDSISFNAEAYCQERGFRLGTSYATDAGAGLANYRYLFSSASSGAQTTTASNTTGATDSFSILRTRSIWSVGWRLYSSETTAVSSSTTSISISFFTDTIIYQPSSSEVISEIWCAD